jgi:diguanylate cyclase (GGDEF)-like protein
MIESMDGMTAIIVVGVLCLLLLIAVIVIFVTQNTKTRQFEQKLTNQQRHLDHQSKTIQDQQDSIHQMGQELQKFKTLLLTFPDLAKEINASLSRKDLEDTMVRTTHHLFGAQATVFLGAENTHLQLKAHRGLSPDQIKRLQQLPIGQGEIGWVAKKQIIMTAQDFKEESILVRKQFLQEESPSLTTDICAPLMHREKLFGVLAVTGISLKKDLFKPLMTVISNLGVVAMENISLIDEIQKQSDQDSVTKLYNSIYFYKYLDREVQNAARYSRPLSIVIFDLDHFKSYNDRHGRVEAEQILRIMGGLVRKDLRTVDIPCRYGGDEFAVILPETPAEGAMLVAERTRRAVEEHRFSLTRMTVSGGVATYPKDADTAAGLLQSAQRALEQAKHAGRNRIFASGSPSKE